MARMYKEDIPYNFLYDDTADDGTIYVGFVNDHGDLSKVDERVFAIKRITQPVKGVSPGKSEWGNGTPLFDKKWSQKESYFS